MDRTQQQPMNRLQENPTAHLEDVDLLLQAEYDTMPGEETLVQNDVDRIPKVDVTPDDLLATGENTEDWLMAGGAYDNQRRFPGDSIDPDTVDDLTVEYQIDLPQPGTDGTLTPGNNYQGTPVIVSGDPPVMYVTFGPDVLYALDAQNGDVLWSYKYEPTEGAVAASAPAERGVTIHGDLVLKSTLDLGIVALDRYTGERQWYYNGMAAYRDEIAEDNVAHEELVWERFWGTTSSFPPLAYDGKIMKGSFGGEFGVSGFFDAVDLDGKPQWRASMTPEDEWVGDSWMHGGGTAWASGAVDVETGTVIVPSANPGPWYGTPRPGWNPFTAGKVAFNVDDGSYSWHHQGAPHDWWDYDSPSPPLVYTAEVDGEERRLISWPGKVGWVFTVDAETGKLVQRSEEYVQHINMWDLPPRDDIEAASYTTPTYLGGTNPQPSSYHPESQTMIVRGANSPSKFSWTEDHYEVGEFFYGMSTQGLPSAEDLPEWNEHDGVIAGLDPVTGEVKWQDWMESAPSGGSMTTAGGVSFSGAAGGEFVAYRTDTDNEEGERLWSDTIGGSVAGTPAAWEDPATGKAYVAVKAGGDEAAGHITVYSVGL
ncbi:outer membrane protein assembly factor BamB family protein [Halolamina salifodinae]|uniref:Alcohol dehydrogenase (Cytochrome c) n=1 Tax=Halolamina salifodinae TaxID=1202767 RepID=A0A8T4GUC7_9EURY|nr:PQQ-binding-like beta-propeller repeat protein [Halolamina salifodinae]MBP1986486.1 alcohol dehydrogenase (cytochrome c) [Halolamina salifodinae]